ncbi:MAG TPA: alpha/beta fold hydrolase [Baekduia sp.]|uniref:alpha/beta fold hydrolase n=1 Tax=Baekduia sp. TaxID=2600305 RepID=UPI002D794E58|nr:alpha/beta fold hydrolase [Baekduia sp.]HET6509000.1 alpha/beta fold hydrolase [Baekduia sp.]
MPEPREGTVELPEGHLWYWDTGGDGPPVVLLHAGTGSALSWPQQRDPLIAAGYRVVAYSRRGHHRSSPLTPDAPGCGADDLGALTRALELEPFHAVAAAGGGYFATDFALSRPERVRSLTIVSSLMGISEPEWQARVRSLSFPGFMDLPHDFLELGPSYRAEDPEGVAEWNRLHALAYDGASMVAQDLRNDITWERLGQLAMPVLLVGGGADLILPAPAVREVARHIPGARMAEIADAGHSAPWERPSRFNGLLLDFLGSVV